jgi:ATP-dependent RNA helicase DeaD
MKETGRLKQIERIARKKFERKMVPNGDEICEKQMFHLIDRVVNVDIAENQIGKYMPLILEKFETMSKEEIVKHFVSLEFNQLMEYYKNAKDLNIRVDAQRDPSQRNDRGGERMKFTKLFINVGKKQNLNASGLIGLINEYSKRHKIEIGRIDIQRKFSFFEIDSNYEKELIKSLNNQVVEGHLINIGRVESNSPEAQREGGSGGSFRRDKFDSGSRNGRREGGRRDGGYNDRGDRSRGRRN